MKQLLGKKKNKNKLTFVEHLEDLRWTLIKIILSISIGAIVVFIKLDFFFDNILMAPAKKDFVSFKVLCFIGKKIGMDSWCNMQYDVSFQSTKMAAQFMMSFVFAFAMGVVIAFPYIIYQLWKFIQPALVEKEELKIKGFVGSVSFFFICGVLFAYYVIAPYSFMFFANYQLSEVIENKFLISDYVTLITQIVIGCGLLFQLPMLVYVLTKVGLLTPELLKKNKKYVIVIILLLSAIITPPDVFSQVIVSIPLFILMEFSVLVSKYAYKTLPKI